MVAGTKALPPRGWHMRWFWLMACKRKVLGLQEPSLPHQAFCPFPLGRVPTGASASCEHEGGGDMLRMAERWARSQWPELQPSTLHASSPSGHDHCPGHWPSPPQVSWLPTAAPSPLLGRPTVGALLGQEHSRDVPCGGALSSRAVLATTGENKSTKR